MSVNLNPMDKFDFLLGRWKMEFYVPKSKFSEADTGQGTGEFKRILNDKYVTFDYSSKYSAGEGTAHGIFAWDDKRKIYRYWWFENSGEFNEATCDFIDQNTLFMNWQNSVLVQTFIKLKNGNIKLDMQYPVNANEYKTVLEIRFSNFKKIE